MVTTEVIRQGLISAAVQMRQAMIRSAFSPIIYEALDFAVALYDRDFRLLAQAPTLLSFTGALEDCVREAVASVGGIDALKDGDVVMANDPYSTGSHPNDVLLVAPCFASDGGLIGFSVVKAHWLDVGGKSPYISDSTDVYQEGIVIPGVKLRREGVLHDDLYRILMINTRVPRALDGDMRAQCIALRIGNEGFAAIVDRYGQEMFWRAVESIFDHGEATMRHFIQSIPDGTFVGHGVLDNDGISLETRIELDITVHIKGSDVTIDCTAAPPAARGPMNVPRPTTLAIARVAMVLIAGGGGSPNEGSFRPIRVATKPGTLLDPVRPQPTFLYGVTSKTLMEAIFRALGGAHPQLVAADSGCESCLWSCWGTRAKTGESWADGGMNPVGLGAGAGFDGITAMHSMIPAARTTPVESREHRFPVLVQRYELAPDSCGAGRFRGGLGLDYDAVYLEPVYITNSMELTLTAPGGLAGGSEARPNHLEVEFPDGRVLVCPKVTGLALPAGSVVRLRSGGGGGHGPASERDPVAVRKDLEEGYLTPQYVAKHYPRCSS